GQVGLPNEAAPRILNKSWTLTADIEVPEAGVEGMIVTHGGLVGGDGLDVREGKATFVYNYLELLRPTIMGKDALPKGKGVSANTSRTVLCQYIPNSNGATIAPKSDPTGGNLMSKQRVRPSVVKPW